MSAIDRIGGWSQLLATLLRGEDLPANDAQVAMNAVLLGEASPAQIAAFVMALRSKGETADELQGMLAAVLDASESVPLSAKLSSHAIDIVGTGGDKSHSVNISTMAAFVVAGAGVPVCKHGNRAASSQCGTADVLEALGVKIDLDGEGVAQCVALAGMGFCFAQNSIQHFDTPGQREKNWVFQLHLICLVQWPTQRKLATWWLGWAIRAWRTRWRTQLLDVACNGHGWCTDMVVSMSCR